MSPQDEQQAGGLTDLEKQLAHFRMLIEKKWGNDNNNSCTYIYPDGTSLSLTPHVMNPGSPLLTKADLVTSRALST
jgi:hypothetical protein